MPANLHNVEPSTPSINYLNGALLHSWFKYSFGSWRSLSERIPHSRAVKVTARWLKKYRRHKLTYSAISGATVFIKNVICYEKMLVQFYTTRIKYVCRKIYERYFDCRRLFTDIISKCCVFHCANFIWSFWGFIWQFYLITR